MLPPPILAGFFDLEGLVPLIIVCVVGLLIFGKRLPEIGKSVGKGIVEFKKGLSGVEDDLNKAGSSDAAALPPPAVPNPSLPQPSSADTQQQLQQAQEAIRQLQEELRQVKQKQG